MRKTEAMDYPHALYWIIRERGGGGGWPPRDVATVSGWKVVQFTAAMFNKSVREVAADLIEAHTLSEGSFT
jgi:hypothetical protein